MNKTLKGLTAGAVLALAAGVLGVTSASAAVVTGTVAETTNFTCTTAGLFTADASNPVPLAGTALAYDIEKAVNLAIPSPAAFQVADAIQATVTGLAAAPYNVPEGDFVNLPTGTAPTAVLPAAGDTTVTLYAVDVHGSTFEVSGVKGGAPLGSLTALLGSGSCGGSFAWSQVTRTKVDQPHLTGGHVISVSNNDAEIGWTDGPGVHYVLTRTFGFGMTAANGDPHYGFTGITTGYWGGLAAGHTYDIELIPAGANRQPLPDAQVGWINVVTTR